MRFLPLLCAFVLFASACDTTPSVSAIDVDGEYVVTELVFESQAAIVGTVNILGYIRQLEGGPDIRLDLFGRTRQYVFAFRFPQDVARNSITGGFVARGSGQIELRLGEENRVRRRLLLPAVLPLSVDRTTGVLTGSYSNYEVEFADLAELDRDRFGGLGGTTRGTLRLRAVRVQ